jgi:hypothetical protein
MKLRNLKISGAVALTGDMNFVARRSLPSLGISNFIVVVKRYVIKFTSVFVRKANLKPKNFSGVIEKLNDVSGSKDCSAICYADRQFLPYSSCEHRSNSEANQSHGDYQEYYFLGFHGFSHLYHL